MGSKGGLMVNAEDFDTEVLSLWQISSVTLDKLPMPIEAFTRHLLLLNTSF